MTETTIGIDISKATLDAHRLSDGATVQFSNDKAGFRMLKAWLKGKRRLHPIDISIEFNGFAVGVHVHELAGESRTSSF